MSEQRYCNTVEAKTKLSELLDYVSSGQEVVIRRRGRAVARLVPASDDALDAKSDVSAMITRLREFHKRLRQAHGDKSDTVAILRELREES
jgi:prevent-host-death family protein